MNKLNGLTVAEVENRILNGQINYDVSPKTQSIEYIILSNILTPFNLLNFFLAFLLIMVGSYKNLFFLGVVISNTLLSIIQKIRSKKVIDRLNLLVQSNVLAVRDGKEVSIDIHSIVLGDLIIYKIGNQIVSDAKVVSGQVLVNEAFLTGESEPVLKKVGDTLLSGSFVVGGKCYSEVINVADDNYTAKITKEAKYIKTCESEIMNTINKIVHFIAIIIVPLGIIFFLSQYNLEHDFTNSIIHTVAALVVMIPDGLVLLISVVFCVGVIRLSKYSVLVQDMNAIESLARVDVICLDKTGTLTEGKLEVSELKVFSKKYNLDKILGTYASASTDENSTMLAIKNKFTDKYDFEKTTEINFSSDKKYSVISFKNEGTFILGAVNYIQTNIKSDLQKKIDSFSKHSRVIGIYHSNKLADSTNFDDVELLGLILIKDVIRESAKKTLKYFKDCGVSVKIISGDDPVTVSSIAATLGIDDSDKYIDLSTVSLEDLETVIRDYTIFGRVTPDMKKNIVLALKKAGHTVAMTGDGVNDCLALKEADCSIAMASGSESARNVSDLILLDSDFKSVPKIVLEGRRSVNNIERSSSLFLTKTIYATVMVLFFMLVSLPYPFIPLQLTLISTTTIGIPSFFLALEKNDDIIKGRFFYNILANSLPASITVLFHVISLSIIQKYDLILPEFVSTIAVLLTAYIGFLLIIKLSTPWNKYRSCLFLFIFVLFALQFLFLKSFYSLETLNFYMLSIVVGFLLVENVVYQFNNKFILRILNRNKNFSNMS